MNITQAITQADQTSLSLLQFKAVKMYGGDKQTKNGDFIYKVMADTPQGSPNVYVTFFSPTRPNIVDGQEYEVRAQVTGQGARGITVSHFNGKAGVNINKEATLNPMGAGLPTPQVPEPVAQPQYAPPQEDPAFVHPTVAPAAIPQQAPPAAQGTGGSKETKLTRAQLLTEMKSIYTEALAVSADLGPDKQLAFAKQAMASVPAYWFGDKMSY